MSYVWETMVLEEKASKVFWGGGVANFAQFMLFMQDEKNFPLLVLNGNLNPVAIAWLNGVELNHAIAHFCVLGRWDKDMGSVVMDFWKGLIKPDGTPMLRVILGFIPEVNARAIDAIKSIGFVVLGKIPNMCTLADDQTTVGATVMYYDLDERRD
jgi:hypothetical protein